MFMPGPSVGMLCDDSEQAFPPAPQLCPALDHIRAKIVFDGDEVFHDAMFVVNVQQANSVGNQVLVVGVGSLPEGVELARVRIYLKTASHRPRVGQHTELVVHDPETVSIRDMRGVVLADPGNFQFAETSRFVLSAGGRVDHGTEAMKLAHGERPLGGFAPKASQYAVAGPQVRRK